ncbi:hypothetical protein ACFP3Q_10405 [Nocardioides sp. GCM10027113]|uniref:hypothetical protein n=1 Tax=unclassified Nocardioides TaxID=2615069 RepID=UPI00361532C7
MSKTWQVGSALLLGAVLAAGAAPAAASPNEAKAEKKSSGAIEPGQQRGAKVLKVGWWWSLHEPPPDTGVVAPTFPGSPNIPQGTFPVAAVNGDAEKVAAIELVLRADTGAKVKKLDLVLRESAEPGTNAHADAARILACPITEVFWADGAGSAWKDKPTYDCETASAVGKRDENGLWRFDLSEIAQGWLAEDNANSRAVVLVEDVEAPESFQVVFDGVKEKGIGLRLQATPPAAVEEPGAPGGTDSDSGSSGSPASVGGGGGVGGGLSVPSGGGAPLDAGGDLTAADDLGGGGELTAAGEAETTSTAAATTPVAAMPAWYSGIPKAGLLLLPLGLVLAYVIMLALGPAGRPVVATGRHGVSRALDRLRFAGRDMGRGR